MSEKMLTTFELSARIGLARATLAKLRVIGGGPPFRKLGRTVVYPERELAAWLRSHPLHRSTGYAEVTDTGQSRALRSQPEQRREVSCA